MNRLIVGNWKMNFTPEEAVSYTETLEAKLPTSAHTTVVICPSTISLYPVRQALKTKNLGIGAQNIYFADSGAYTGETSATMLIGIAKYAIIGHSERRSMGEYDKLIAKKVAAALRNDIIPILCVGETLDERHHDLSTKVVMDQLTSDLHDLTASDVAKIVIAYEPVWAIGTGEFAVPDQVTPMVSAIRSTVEDLYGEEGGVGIKVLYGGSVNPDNSMSYLKVEGVDGLLIGGASLVEADFSRIVAIAESLN
jgi:triosephosphate isomerase